ncbi:hypothetical protein ACTP13_17815 [Paenibacillus peoriae]
MTHWLGYLLCVILEAGGVRGKEAGSNFEQLSIKFRKGADLIVIMDSGELNTGSYGISDINRSEGRTGIIWKRGCCGKE